MDGDRGRFFVLFWSFGTLDCIKVLHIVHFFFFLAHDVFILMSIFFMSCI